METQTIDFLLEKSVRGRILCGCDFYGFILAEFDLMGESNCLVSSRIRELITKLWCGCSSCLFPDILCRSDTTYQ